MAQNLEIVINAQDKTEAAFGNASRSLEGLSDRIESMKPTFQSLATAGTVAFGAITSVAVSALKESAAASADMAIANKTLENALISMGEAGREAMGISKDLAINIDEVKGSMELASKAALKLGFDDEAASKSFAKLFQVTKSTAQANKELGIAMDMARARGISLEDATQKLVMVHSGATKQLKAEGLAIDENATALENITSLSKVYANQASEAAKTVGVQFQIVQLAVDNLKQAIGDSLAPAFASLIQKINPVVEKLQAWAEKNPELIAKVMLIGGAIAGLTAAVGFLGLALPALITGFSLLTGPVGIIIGLIALAVINFDKIKAVVIDLMGVLADNGVFIYFHEIWTNITNNFQQNLLPALQQLWVALQPLMPYFVAFTKVLGVGFLVAIMAVGKILEGWIYIFSALLEVAIKVGTYIATNLKPVFDGIASSINFVIDKVNSLINSLQSLWSSMSKFGGSAMSSIGGMFGGGQRVNDAIIAPSGRVVTPANDDYIVATKNPSSFFGGGQNGGAFNININGAIFTEDAATQLGNLIVDRFKTASRVGL